MHREAQSCERTLRKRRLSTDEDATSAVVGGDVSSYSGFERSAKRRETSTALVLSRQPVLWTEPQPSSPLKRRRDAASYLDDAVLASPPKKPRLLTYASEPRLSGRKRPRDTDPPMDETLHAFSDMQVGDVRPRKRHAPKPQSVPAVPLSECRELVVYQGGLGSGTDSAIGDSGGVHADDYSMLSRARISFIGEAPSVPIPRPPPVTMHLNMPLVVVPAKWHEDLTNRNWRSPPSMTASPPTSAASSPKIVELPDDYPSDGEDMFYTTSARAPNMHVFEPEPEPESNADMDIVAGL